LRQEVRRRGGGNRDRAVENIATTSSPKAAICCFTCLVLLKSPRVKFEDVEAALAQRTSMSGLEEKAARKRDQ